MTFRVEASDGSRHATAFEGVLSGADADRFHDGTADLAGFAGAGVTLTLVAEASDPETDARLLPFWSEPTVDGHPDSSDARPNVLVLMLDTLRADRLGCYGSGLSTPNIDALARLGVRFADAMSPAAMTLTSHASMFSSSYPPQHGVDNRERLGDEAVTLAEMLRRAGYQTHALSEGVFVHPKFGFAQGFDSFTTYEGGVTVTFPAAVERLERIRGRFFLFVQTYEVHAPYDPPRKQRERIVGPYDGPLPRTVRPVHWKEYRDVIGADDARYMRELYDAEIALTDVWVGRMIGALQRLGRLEDTLVILTSDHGEEFLDHGAFGHGHSLYQELLHVPLVVYQKGRFEGGLTVEHPVHGVDLAPTILDAAGIARPPAWEGRPYSLEAETTGRPLLSSYHDPGAKARLSVLREGSLKVIQTGEPGRARVFDLATDPGEGHDLWGPERAAALQRLEELLARLPPIEGAAVEAEVTGEMEAELEALGYAGEDEDEDG